MAAAKQPYSVVALVFVIIPVARFGSVKKFILSFAVLMIIIAVVSQLWTAGRVVASKISENRYERHDDKLRFSADLIQEDLKPGKLSASMLPMLPHEPVLLNATREQSQENQAPAGVSAQPQPNDATRVNTPLPVDPIDPAGQKHFILSNPIQYTGILIHSLQHSMNLYLTSFVGLFGWIDTPMPAVVSYGYLLLLLFIALAGDMNGRRIGVIQKLVFAAVFILGIVLIETALYVYCNPVGCDPITAVQGRYFIAIGPLFFLLFTNDSVRSLFAGRAESRPASGKKASPKKAGPPPGLPLLPWVAVTFAATTWICSVFVILERFYVIVF